MENNFDSIVKRKLPDNKEKFTSERPTLLNPKAGRVIEGMGANTPFASARKLLVSLVDQEVGPPGPTVCFIFIPAMGIVWIIKK